MKKIKLSLKLDKNNGNFLRGSMVKNITCLEKDVIF